MFLPLIVSTWAWVFARALQAFVEYLFSVFEAFRRYIDAAIVRTYKSLLIRLWLKVNHDELI